MMVLRFVDKMAAVPENAVVLRLFGQVDKPVLLEVLADGCGFPAYFGHNWDAAWECLLDCTVSDVVLDVRAAQYIVVDDLAVLVSLFVDAEAECGQPRLWCLGADAALRDALAK